MNDTEQVIKAGKARLSGLSGFGVVKTLTEWTRDPRCVVGMSCLRYRLGAGWPLEIAMTTASGTARKAEAGKARAAEREGRQTRRLIREANQADIDSLCGIVVTKKAQP